MRPSPKLLLVVLAGGLVACAGKSKLPPDDAPTLASLAGRSVPVAPDAGIRASEEQAIAAYRKFLDIAANAPQRAEAMRRLGDLEMDLTDRKLADGAGGQTTTGAPDYRAAVSRYQDYLKSFPADKGNDRVLYQLARAQEQGGELEASLRTLDRLVADFPQTAYRAEAHFRRGELLFSMRDYPKAEKAYTTVLSGDSAGGYRERALYMQGWSLFKQAKLEESLHAFFGVLDLKVANVEGDGELESLSGLARADRELVEDTFRVTSLSLANLQGAETIPGYMTTPERRSYEFRVYQQLGELYIKQDRTKDAADAMGAFVRRYPLHAQAPVMQARVIDIYQRTGFANLALDAKKDYVSRYGIESEFRRANAVGWEKAQPLVKTHLGELARHYHASAQKSRASTDYREAVRWYRAYITSFPKDPEAAQSNFLLAELLYEDARFAEAAVEYERTAYGYPSHAKGADAGYAALLSHAALEKRAVAADLPGVQRAAVDSALRFGQAHASDPRAGAVLTNAAEKLFALKDTDRAYAVAQQVLALSPPADAAQRRVAWTVVSHTAFERGAFAEAEKGYAEVLALTGERDTTRNDLVERLAAAVYKQGEQARAAGNAAVAVGHFERVAAVAPLSPVRATAQYDAAAALIGLKDWDAAARTLEDFRQRFPNHPLQGEVGGKLAAAYLERGQWQQAAGEFERQATVLKDPAQSRAALWQAAELYEKGGGRAPATRAYERYVLLNPLPLEPAIEARHRLARMAKADGNLRRESELMKAIHQADLTGGAGRTDRTRALGGLAALSMAEPLFEEYRKVALVEPLQRQLKLKKTRMEAVLAAYAAASEYGVAEVTTAATYQTAALYQDFGKALINSQRPKKLSKLELEQYTVLLEEQAFPFEEKATELHEVNARRAAEGTYDKWVANSFKALAELRPVRYGKNERSEGVVHEIR